MDACLPGLLFRAALDALAPLQSHLITVIWRIGHMGLLNLIAIARNKKIEPETNAFARSRRGASITTQRVRQRRDGRHKEILAALHRHQIREFSSPGVTSSSLVSNMLTSKSPSSGGWPIKGS